MSEHVVKSVTFDSANVDESPVNHTPLPSDLGTTSPNMSPSGGSSIPLPLVNLSRKQVPKQTRCRRVASYVLLQLELLATSIGARIEQLSREDALRQICVMKGVSPPKLPLTTSPPKISPRQKNDGTYRSTLRDDAVSRARPKSGSQGEKFCY